ncbi:hypothetical protein HAX54_050935 [Datura stramonium]|uniref:Uncharacterized protein n=1 Tax=Datura stramonium TaxID=4076 RepID=A0ABS8WNY1_DATST|nr:hypothetical protein [Datura stramonium]
MPTSLHEPPIGRRLNPVHLGIQSQSVTHLEKCRYKVRTISSSSAFVVHEWLFVGGGADGYGSPKPLIYTDGSLALRRSASAFRRWLVGVT